MRDLDVGPHQLQAFDLIAARGGRGVACACEHQRHRPVVGPIQLGAVEPARARGGQQQLQQVRAQAWEHRLGLGVAEAHVELEHARAVGGEHQPRVEHAVERRPALAHQVHDRLVHAGGELAHAAGVEAGHRRVGAHPARVGSLIAVEDALEVAGGRHRHGTHPVAQREQRQLLAHQQLLHDCARPALAETTLEEDLTQRGACLRPHPRRPSLPCPRRARRPSRRRLGWPALAPPRCPAAATPRVASARLGTPACSIASLANAFEPSSRAAAALGPNAA